MRTTLKKGKSSSDPARPWKRCPSSRPTSCPGGLRRRVRIHGLGILKYKWYINEIAGIFLAMGVLSGLLGRLKGEEIGRAFVDGAKDMVNAALIIGTARAILIVATDGRIMDTILAGMAGAISGLHPILSAQLMFLSQCGINFFVHSGTAQAALTIPVMAPLGDLVGNHPADQRLCLPIGGVHQPDSPDLGGDDGCPGAGRAALRKVGQVADPSDHRLGRFRAPEPDSARAL